MRHLHRGLQQYETLLGFERIDPPPPHVVGQNREIPDRVFSAKAELKAPFAVFVPVTDPQIAASLRQNGHYIRAKGGSVIAGVASPGAR
jgi:hypothetical protein